MQVVLRTARVTWPTCGIRSLVWLVSGILSSPYVIIRRCPEGVSADRRDDVPDGTGQE